MYGREGKRTQYTPYNCSKIIMGNAPSGSGDRHGCPYKHYDAEHLSQLLLQLKVGTSVDRQAIVRLKKENQFQLACQKHFEVTHPGASSMDIPLDNVGNHPNSWFRASVSYSEAKSGGMDVDGDKAIVGSF
jgi:DNA primase large subunit